MSALAWDALHADVRHQLRYPSEHVVRFLAGLNLARPATDPYFGRVLDIGCGGGRHTRLLMECAFDVVAFDSSTEAQADIVGDMGALPFADNVFDIALSYGVFYYGTWSEMQRAVNEMYRVLRPRGRGFVCVRSTKDWRMGRGEKVEQLTYRLNIPDEPEDGMTMNFLPVSRIEAVYAAFSEIEVEKATVTRRGMSRVNSDWLITVTK